MATSLNLAPSSPETNIRLLVLDIDGTLVGPSNQVREPVKQAVQAAKAKDIQVAIATGRMYQSALRFHQAVGSTLPLIAYQGALIRDPVSQEIHRHQTVTATVAAQLLDHFEQPEWCDRLSVHFYINDELFVRELNAESVGYAERSQVKITAVGDLRQVLNTPPTKVLAISDELSLIQSLFATLQQRYPRSELYLTRSTESFFEAAHPEVNKGAAVKYLAESLLGFQPHEVMAIGDNFNDVEMLDYAGLGIAMGNAPPEVQAIADWVSPTVHEDGVAAAIKTFILKD